MKIFSNRHRSITGRSVLRRAAALFAAVLFLAPLTAYPAPPPSLKTVPAPKPSKLALYVANEAAAIRLGKALFWDMQVGSDGMVACASCHFHAGTDSRVRNTMNPGQAGGDTAFDLGKKPNDTVKLSDFPFFKLSDPHNRGTGGIDPNDPAVARRSNDVVGAQGVPLTDFKGIRSGNGADAGRHSRDPLFGSQGRNLRRVTGRNTPSVINAVHNFANFWDGRANHFFNGKNPFGIQDVNARILVNDGGSLAELDLNLLENQLDNASLASQAVGPPLNDVEMSWAGRSFPELGRKMISVTPLGKQLVHREDSVHGSLAKNPEPGLNTTYSDMIKAAFLPRFWDSNESVTVDGKSFTQMEANFSFFFGVSIMLYEATLVSDDTPFDRFLFGDVNALTERQLLGMNLFFAGGVGCFNCHRGPELTGASVGLARSPLEPGLIELMTVGDGQLANYDIGFYNIGVTPTAQDIGRGGSDPFGFPLSFSRQNFLVPPPPFSFPKPGCVNDFIIDPPTICPPSDTIIPRVAADGSFKTPGLRNVELTGPYFHNGGMATLRQVVDFYIRGGNFHEANIANLDPFIVDINGLKGDNKEPERDALVDFLLSLTDERVRWERAPFDHPQLFILNGHEAKITGDPRRTRVLADNILELPAVGRSGRTLSMGPLKPFLDNGDPLFHFRP